MPRLQIDLSEEGAREIDEIMRKTGLKTKKDFFNQAASLLSWAIEEKERGHDIGVIGGDDGGNMKLLMPILETVRKRAQTNAESTNKTPEPADAPAVADNSRG